MDIKHSFKILSPFCEDSHARRSCGNARMCCLHRKNSNVVSRKLEQRPNWYREQKFGEQRK